MAILNVRIPTNLTEYPNSFKRQGSFPLEAYSVFYDIANDEFYIPGLLDGFVPQGFTYLEDERVFLSCGYMSDGDEPSRIYVIDEDGEEFYYTELTDSITSVPYTGHTGGIACFGEYVYITGSDGIDVFDINSILDESIEVAQKLGTVDTSAFEMDPAFCFVYEEQLYVGSFHDGEKYTDPEKHKINIEGRDKNNATMLSFTLSASDRANYNVSPTPNAVYSIPNKVQGVCVIPEVRDNSGKVTESAKMVLSTSYGMSASNLYVHDIAKIEENTYNSTISKEMIGVSVPLYVIDSQTQVNSLEAPPMAEEIVYYDGKVWIMNESASAKYVFGKFTTGNTLFSVNYPFPKN